MNSLIGVTPVPWSSLLPYRYVIGFGHALIICGTLIWIPSNSDRLITMGFLSALLILSLFDCLQGLIYDRLLLPLTVLGLVASYLDGMSMADLVSGAITGGGLLYLLRFVTQGGLGLGDVKFGGVLGIWLGLSGIIPALFFAFLFGGLTALFFLFRHHRGHDTLPFGPFLSLGALTVFFAGEEILAVYGSFL